MIISNYLRMRLIKPTEDRLMAQGRAQARAETEQQIAQALAEANRKVQEWDRRRMRAILLNQPFHEPPPDLTKP